MKWGVKLFLVGIAMSLVLCNFVIGLDPPETKKEITIVFSNPVLIDQGNFLSLEIQESSSYLMEPGQPLLPVYTVSLNFTFPTQIDDIKLYHLEKKEMIVDKKIVPAPAPIALGYEKKEPSIVLKTSIYESTQSYPNTWYTYTLGGGICDGKRATILSIHITPIKYFPSQDKICYINEITLSISYSVQPPSVSNNNVGPQFVIITPLYYSIEFLKLVEHKNSLGLSTSIVTLEDIFDGTYFPVEGRDDQEKIKYFIKNAIEQWGTSYILLGGGYRDIPVRQSYVPTFLPPEEHFPSDLYYADIYDFTGKFSSWDSNNNDIFGEFHYQNRSDETDLYPDVYLGRLACDSINQVTVVVDKIIDYEDHSYGKLWFKNIVVCAGDTFPDDSEKINEGEFATNQILNSMSDFNPTKLWVSLNTLDTRNIRTAISYGAGFVDFSGHGSESSWKTYFHGDLTKEVNFGITDISLLTNREKLPIITLSACLCGKFDEGNCLAWHLVKEPNGGGIASLASTGIAYGIEGHSQIERWTGWIETHFYEYYRDTQTNYNLGKIWERTIREYLNRFKTSDADYKTVEEWILFGDPSLTVGGYQNLNGVSVHIDKPTGGYLYRNDDEVTPTLFGKTIIWGGITVKVSASSTIKGVEFYIDDMHKFTDTSPPYEWCWHERAFFLYKLRIVGYTDDGDIKEDSLDVRIFNLKGC